MTENIRSWHSLSIEDTFLRLDASETGLSSAQAALLLKKHGRNTLPSRASPSVAIIFLRQFLSPLIYILLAAGVASLFIGESTDAVFIFAVILLNALIGAFQELKAEKSAAALQKLLRIKTRILRDGAPVILDASELVPGDIVMLESGNKVPADVRLLRVNGLSADESLLTGESVTVDKNILPVEEKTGISGRTCMAFAGSTVMSGRGTGIVASTGLFTEVGKIAQSVASTESAKPPLVIRMEKFSRQVGYAVVGACSFLALAQLARGESLSSVFFMAVALAVSAIPEGLPVALTVALSIASTRMSRRNVIVRRLAAVESLGSCTVIASDKTGTLTVNEQTVRQIMLPSGESFVVSGEGYSGEGEVNPEAGRGLSPAARGLLEEISEAAVLCNEADLRLSEGKWDGQGDAMDIALMAFAYKLGLDPYAVRKKYVKTKDIPFESELKFSAVFYQLAGKDEVVVKGAVETVLGFCAKSEIAGESGRENTKDMEEKAAEMASEGYRILAVAKGNVPNRPGSGAATSHDIPPLTLLGLAAFMDPARPEVKGAVEKCRSAGVDVLMITGDHPATALAIAKELGISRAEEKVVTGTDLEEAGTPNGSQFDGKVASSRVFARIAPLQKLQIVESLIKAGHFVAVTGDGVNDAPALRRANIGVAMGSGTDVAKDTGEMIITDDNFASIVGGIEEGRFAYANVRKVIYLLISTGVAEIILFSLAIFSGLPVPLLAVQLLWLNLVTNGIQDVTLAFEGGEPGAMLKPPRKPSEGVFDRLMMTETMIAGAVMGVTAYCAWLLILASGAEENYARNLVLLLMVLLENVHVFNCRSEEVSAFRVPLRRNLFLIAGVALAQGIHIASMHLPFMQKILRIAPVSYSQWLMVMGAALLLLAVMEVFKAKRGAKRPLQGA
ncbi:MAG: ATPase [Elusimicrobia bacterium GWA2_51_34]|nr:MAG: ATPase [Elusimicrobia bacterium GWA2_51_34]